MVHPTNPASSEPRRPVALMGTLMPHLADGRHHLYRNLTGLVLLAALIAAGLGSLPVALVLAAVALPAAVLVYIHDHRLWRTEPITLITLAFGLALVLGVGVGLLETYFVDSVVAWGAPGYHLPPVSRILKLGVLMPVVAFAAVLIAPLLISTRSAFRHPMDVVMSCSLGGAALSLGLSVVVQHGAFTHVQATTGDPAHVAFIALTLGFLQPIILATAAMVGVLGLRVSGVNTVAGVLQGLVLVVTYELATTLMQPDGTRGIVLTALAAFVLAGAGMWAARNALHAATAADSGRAETAEEREEFEHRLNAAAMAAVIVVVVVVAAAISLAVAEGGNSTPPTPPGRGGGIAPGAAAAAGPLVPNLGQPGEKRSDNVHLASVTKPLALAFGPIDLGSGVSVAPAQGWTVLNQDRQWVDLTNPGHDAIVYASVGKANKQDVVGEANLLINQNIRSGGLTNVQQNSSARPVPLQGRNFQQLIELDYTADAQSNQGTMQIWGGWIVLFNSSTQISAFFNYFASSQETFKSSLTDAAGMLSSME